MSNLEWDLLKGLQPDDLEAILALGSPRTLAEGEVLFELGDEADAVFLVQRGRVTLTLPLRVEGEHQDVMVEERLEGQLLGWSGLVPPHRFTLQSRAPVETELLVLPRQELLSLFSQQPEVGYTVLSNLARIVGQRLQVFQTMWLREMQRVVERRSA